MSKVINRFQVESLNQADIATSLLIEQNLDIVIMVVIEDDNITSLLIEQNLERAPIQRKTCSSGGFPWNNQCNV